MELYTLTERARSKAEGIFAGACGVLAVLCIVVLYFNVLAFFPAVVFGILWYVFSFRRFLEYEVSYFDGEFHLAKVMNKSRRKRLMAFSMDDVIQIAPAGDRSVSKYEMDSTTKVVDCSSRVPEANVYEIVTKNESKVSLIKVEFDEKMLNEICRKYPQKIIRQ